MKAETQDFFDLPIEEKNKYWHRPGDIEGFGQLFIASEEQKLDWGYGFTIFTLPIHSRRPHLFPKLPLPFRMNYDPPCQQPEQVIGLNSHSDASALTILLQINEMDGLQIKKDGNWVLVKLLPDAFIINVGDVLDVALITFYCLCFLL
ncbi:hypothetical protein WN944_007162 [Citrus x changshan-huyou]|uniref:Fe2OG dioxygenase domain-containing protein n=1 Tax=Citrus x changshan-huyou TaxID=2935761 RepID=A0AAP0QUI8_9ROSI